MKKNKSTIKAISPDLRTTRPSSPDQQSHHSGT